MHWRSFASAVPCLGLHFSLTSADSLPNPNCTHNNNILRCDDVDLSGNFTAALISHNVTEVSLGSECHAALNDPPYYCNVLGEDVRPFPSALASLKTVHFQGFRSEQRGDFQFSAINAVLENIKGQLTAIRIFGSKLHKLGSRCFNGYSNLQSLSLGYNRIQDISSDVFVEMRDAGTAPVLSQLSIFCNVMTSFDWGALRPVSANLRYIDLGGQKPGLQKLFRSSVPFSMPSLAYVLLARNKLTTAPVDMLEAISGADELYLDLTANSFCIDSPDCSCCALKDLGKWMNSRAKQRTSFKLHLDCANRHTEIYFNSSISSNWSLPHEFSRLTDDCPLNVTQSSDQRL